VMDQVLLTRGRPIATPQWTLMQDPATFCTFKNPAGEEYLTSCEITQKSLSEPCPILKTSCEENVCRHLVPNATDERQPPTIDQSCYYPYPATPPCVEKTIKCTEPFPLPNFFNERVIFWILMGFLLALLFGLTVILYNMTNLLLTVMQSIWSEGTASAYYATEAAGHPKPSWQKLLQATCCLWTANMYLPYFQADWICLSCLHSEPAQAFLSDGESVTGVDVNVDIPAGRNLEAEHEEGVSPDLLRHDHAGNDDNDPLSNTTTASATTTSSSSLDGLARPWPSSLSKNRASAEALLNEHATPTTIRKQHDRTAVNSCPNSMRNSNKSFVSTAWESDQHLRDGRNTLTNKSTFYVGLSHNVELVSSSGDEAVVEGAYYFNKNK